VPEGMDGEPVWLPAERRRLRHTLEHAIARA
jgi:hypothetical protein